MNIWDVVVGAVIGAMLTVAFSSFKEWISYRLPWRRDIRIEIEEERGPISREYGFTEKAVKLTVKNLSGATIEIQDIRLMFTKGYGFPVLPEAPPPRSHAKLPAPLDAGTAKSWYFPAEKLAVSFKNLASKAPSKNKMAKFRPQVRTSTGKIYRGPNRRIATDVNAHWP